MATNPTFQLFSSSNDNSSNGSSLGLGFLDSPEPPRPLPPPPVEVLSSEHVSSSVKFAVEKVAIGELTLLKGRVNTKDVFGLPNSDLVPGVYEGGLKLWEGSIDLVKILEKEVHNGNLPFSGKRVLELGCGHGLPGIYSCLKNADAVHFQDFNAEVLRCLTIPNLNANLSEKSASASTSGSSEVRFFSGDWSAVHQLLPHINDGENNINGGKASGYDIILMAETIYSISGQQSLYGLIKKCLACPNGVVYMAAKKYYFGVGGGTRQFLSMIERDGVLASTLVSEITDGSSNVREVWKLSYK
ncbi:PREDICTED: histidine protein methyltransferase 1 homolog [Tarenaya hassleriana]|uniref:histidine protein methyltransferase 1 homolog n=1 Tax=Tarenaya hassleriana TaxID=28532 RepID=UPI00053C3F1E|nr:PREDICTED: histidine protein methyltransferase 1 homolog [Tarenaya hassleriana]